MTACILHVAKAYRLSLGFQTPGRSRGCFWLGSDRGCQLWQVQFLQALLVASDLLCPLPLVVIHVLGLQRRLQLSHKLGCAGTGLC